MSSTETRGIKVSVLIEFINSKVLRNVVVISIEEVCVVMSSATVVVVMPSATLVVSTGGTLVAALLSPADEIFPTAEVLVPLFTPADEVVIDYVIVLRMAFI